MELTPRTTLIPQSKLTEAELSARTALTTKSRLFTRETASTGELT
jgi:hypothetical protein